MALNPMFDLAKFRMEPPKLYDDKPDWELFLYTLLAVIGATNPLVLSVIPGCEDHPFVQALKAPNIMVPPDSPIPEDELHSPKKAGEEGDKVKKEPKVSGSSKSESDEEQEESTPPLVVPTELKGEIPMMTKGSKPTTLFSSQALAQHFAAADRNKKESLKRILFAYLLQSCSHDRKVMAVMRQGGTDGVACFLALQRHYGGLELVKFQEDQQTIYHSYPKKMKNVSTWLADYLNIVERQEKRMKSPIPVPMKADMIINKLKHLPPFARYYENVWQSLLPQQRPPWDDFIQIVQQIAQGSISTSKTQKLYGTGSSRADPITINLVGARDRQSRAEGVKCYNCKSDHVMKFCLVRCQLTDCPRDGHGPNDCPLRQEAARTVALARGAEIRKSNKSVKGEKAEKVEVVAGREGGVRKKKKERRKMKASDFVKGKKKTISLNAGGSDSSSSESSSEEDEENESDPPVLANRQSYTDNESSDEGDEMGKVGYINHLYALNMMEREETEEGEKKKRDNTPPPPSPLFVTPNLPPSARGKTGAHTGTMEQASRHARSVREGERPAPTWMEISSRIAIPMVPELSNNNFMTTLEMAGDPTPQGAIYPLDDGWGLLRFKEGYKKILLNPCPLSIKEVDGPLLNLHAKPLRPNTCHVSGSKQCEAIAESTGKRCEWKLSSARRGAKGSEGVRLASRLGQGFDFCLRHVGQENKRGVMLELYRSKLNAGYLPPSNSFLLSPSECVTNEWVKPPLEQKGRGLASSAPSSPPRPQPTAHTSPRPTPSQAPSSSSATSSASSSSSTSTVPPPPSSKETAPKPSTSDVGGKVTSEEEDEWKGIPWCSGSCARDLCDDTCPPGTLRHSFVLGPVAIAQGRGFQGITSSSL